MKFYQTIIRRSSSLAYQVETDMSKAPFVMKDNIWKFFHNLINNSIHSILIMIYLVFASCLSQSCLSLSKLINDNKLSVCYWEDKRLMANNISLVQTYLLIINSYWVSPPLFICLLSIPRLVCSKLCWFWIHHCYNLYPAPLKFT